MPTTKPWTCLVPLVLLAALVAPPAAAQFTAPPDRDNTLYEEASQQEGCFASTSNGAGQYLFSGFTNSGEERRAVLRFDLSSIPPGSTVTAATVTLITGYRSSCPLRFSTCVYPRARSVLL